MNTSTTTTLLAETANARPASVKCTFCDAPAAPSDTTDPPACGAHADLLILTEWMRDQGETITPDAVAAHVRRARQTSDFWTITPGEVEAMLPAVVEAAETATHGTQAKNGAKL